MHLFYLGGKKSHELNAKLKKKPFIYNSNKNIFIIYYVY